MVYPNGIKEYAAYEADAFVLIKSGFVSGMRDATSGYVEKANPRRGKKGTERMRVASKGPRLGVSQ
jgi:hypothetical protein